MGERTEAPTWEEVWRLLTEYLPLENAVLAWEAEPEESLAGLQVSDLTRVEVAVALEETFDILCNENHVRHWSTVGDVVRCVQARWKAEHESHPR